MTICLTMHNTHYNKPSVRWPNKTWPARCWRAVKRLASSSWAHPVDRAARAGEFASLVSEAHYYGFYETQLEANEAKELLETTSETSRDCSMMLVDPSRSANSRRTLQD